MNRFLVHFPDEREVRSFKTMPQVEKHLSTLQNASNAYIYKHIANAARTKWVIKSASVGKSVTGRTRVEWTRADELKCFNMYRDGAPASIISRTLGRSIHSVYTKLYQLRSASKCARRCKA